MSIREGKYCLFCILDSFETNPFKSQHVILKGFCFYTNFTSGYILANMFSLFQNQDYDHSFKISIESSESNLVNFIKVPFVKRSESGSIKFVKISFVKQMMRYMGSNTWLIFIVLDLSCPKGWSPFGGSCYHLSNEKHTWDGAKIACENHEV